MKITRIAVHQVTLPLAKPYSLSGGRLVFEELDSTVVRVETDDGLVGWGEGWCDAQGFFINWFGLCAVQSSHYQRSG